MAKRVSFFIGSMHGGGAERVISIIANHYCQIGWNVDIALLFDKDIGYELDTRINIIDLAQSQGSYYKRLPKWLVGIRGYVKKTKPDRIVSFVGRINVLVLTACMGLKIPIIVSERNDPKHDGRSNLMLKICNWSYKRAKTVVYQTKYEQSCFSNKLKNGVVIANPVSIAVEPEKTARPFEIVTAGRLQPQKNQAMLIEAVAQIKEQFPMITLKIYGDGALKTVLQNRIEKLQLADIAELCGNVSDLHDRINGAGIFVLCSEFEGLSNALIEAMRLGLVCISTDYPGADELVIDGENGIIVPCGDVQSLTDAIITVFKDINFRNRLSTSALAFSKQYREAHVLVKWEEVIGR